MRFKATIFVLLTIIFCCLKVEGQPSAMKIWFSRPAENWNEALPVGNGRLGAMIFGGIEKEHLELNESSVWTGEERWDANPMARKTLPEVRKLLFSGKYSGSRKTGQEKYSWR